MKIKAVVEFEIPKDLGVSLKREVLRKQLIGEIVNVKSGDL